MLAEIHDHVVSETGPSPGYPFVWSKLSTTQCRLRTFPSQRPAFPTGETGNEKSPNHRELILGGWLSSVAQVLKTTKNFRDSCFMTNEFGQFTTIQAQWQTWTKLGLAANESSPWRYSTSNLYMIHASTSTSAKTKRLNHQLVGFQTEGQMFTTASPIEKTKTRVRTKTV